jgi:DNA-binding beta-propeller fold protein YncE
MPQPGKVYFYEATGPGERPDPDPTRDAARSVQIVVGDAATKEIIAHYAFPPEMRAAVHTTAVSPDGRFVYVTGPRPPIAGGTSRSGGGLDTPATIIKADALTLQPVEQLVVGGRLHHAQLFQERLLLIDTFARDENGLDVFLMDPNTNEIVGGIRDEDLGGASYTAYTDNEFVYILMEPGGYAASSASGYVAAGRYNRGELAVMRPFWVAKVDPSTWEVVQEYPYPGFRANWIVLDSAREHMYVAPGANSYVSKIRLDTGEVVWTTPTGTGPYGASLNADESQLWVADKGETTGMFGRTITVIDTARGRQLETVFSGYKVDHVLLAPNGREMWATSNGEGRIYVFDAASREQTHVIDMPGFGDPHGLVWVRYDENLVAHVVRDQGGFASGVDPSRGAMLVY